MLITNDPYKDILGDKEVLGRNFLSAQNKLNYSLYTELFNNSIHLYKLSMSFLKMQTQFQKVRNKRCMFMKKQLHLDCGGVILVDHD